MVLTKEELMQRIRDRIGDGTTDEDLSLMEDAADTLEQMDAAPEDGENWKERYEIAEADWQAKYDQQNDEWHMQHKGRHSHKTAQSQRTGIAHEYAGRIYVKQQKAHQTAGYCTGPRRDTTALSQSYYRKEGSHQYSHAGTQAIQAVCQVSTIVGCQHGKQEEGYKNVPGHIHRDTGKGDQHGSAILQDRQEIIAQHAGNQQLTKQLLLGIQAFRTLHHDLDVVIQKTNNTKTYHTKQHRQDLRIVFDIEQ